MAINDVLLRTTLMYSYPNGISKQQKTSAMPTVHSV